MSKNERESRCIICGLQKDGLELKEDYIIALIRFFKRNITKNEKGYRLVVCKDCYIKYAKQRGKFERRRAAYVAIGIVFMVLFVIVSPNKLSAVLYGLLITLFLYLLSLLNYMPALTLPKRPSASLPGERK
ncbi:MAG: hypothetical protein QXR58_00620 [Candidatus Micrarchaeaceae archaeon]